MLAGIGTLRSLQDPKKNRFPKSDHNNKRYGDGNEEKWCHKCRRKHIGRCNKEVTCFKCGKIGQYANKCSTKQDYPNREGATKPNVLPNPKARAFQMILNEAIDDARD